MSELSPPGGSEGYGACDDEGAAFGRPLAFPQRKPFCRAHSAHLLRFAFTIYSEPR